MLRMEEIELQLIMLLVLLGLVSPELTAVLTCLVVPVCNMAAFCRSLRCMQSNSSLAVEYWCMLAED